MYERDRQLVAYEIHDGFTQPLAGALMQLEGGLQLAKSRHPDTALEGCDGAVTLLRESINEARRLMGGLRPAVLEEFGVVAAIENLVGEQRRRTGAAIEVTAEVDFDRLEDPLELAIFRIVQEALANAVNHSGSDRIRVALVQQGDRLRIEAQDEGTGFDPARVEPSCFGLEGIRVRARLFGGNATIQSSPGQGAHLVVELPLVERSADAPDEPAP
jgi:signal transduction histidine kinase